MASIVVSCLIFVIALTLILTERIERTVVAFAGAVAMVGAGIALGFFSDHLAAASMDFETLGLLFGMMLIVALLKPTGFFEYLSAAAARVSRGNPIVLLFLLGGTTTLLSMFLDNVTTIVLIAPVTVLICELLGISALPFLVSEALLSDTGGVATLIGDPPNVLIASASGLTFTDFLTHALPVVVVAWGASLGLIVVLFRRELLQSPRDPRVLQQIDPKEALHDWPTAWKILVVLAVAIVLFVIQEPLHLSSSFIALAAAASALILVRPNIEVTLREVEWSVLVFFSGLFVMVGGLEGSGVLEIVSTALRKLIGGNLMLSAIGLVWVVAALSAVIDNVPITIALIPLVEDLQVSGINVNVLWWALAFGAGFGGNGTIIGSTANVVVAQISRRTREPITSPLWNRRGLPVMMVTCVIASVAIALFYNHFTR